MTPKGNTRPTIAELLELAPQLDRDYATECLARLPDRYFSEYSHSQIAEHVTALKDLSPERPYELTFEKLNDGAVAVTVFSFDDAGILGVITGLLGACGFNIARGLICTFSRTGAAPVATGSRRQSPRPSRRRYGQSGGTVVPARRIVDRFVGRITSGGSVNHLATRLNDLFSRVMPNLLRPESREAARRLVNETVADTLRRMSGGREGALYPVQIEFRNEPGSLTHMSIVGEDTPFFLFALSTALSLHGVAIEAVRITTNETFIRDEFELTDFGGDPLTDKQQLDQIRLSVLLTKQFTFFLDQAPDPFAALVRFEALSREIPGMGQSEALGSLLSQPLVLRELARLLGASDFLWEDFIRNQYESIIQILEGDSTDVSSGPEEVRSRLEAAIDKASDTEARVKALNEFKDTETFLIDLDHIMNPDRDFFFLSSRLADLAEAVVDHAARIAWDEAVARYGVPRTVAGMQAPYAVFGLGKLGGRALGYASDIELLYVYSDSGETDGQQVIRNKEFFERFAVQAAGNIESKREGIFQVDLRLRPYGLAGPHAVSLESFNRYYGREGDAHSYEKLALTRLRFVAGDPSLGDRVERIRDDLIYDADSIDLAELRTLREKQLAEKATGGRLNAKFSPGGLVDLEYGLQILLVQHGRTDPSMRTPSLHSALAAFEISGLMEAEEADRLVRAYRFLRNLINGLRMLRGNAQDLFLPEVESLEYSHLARRAGYTGEGDLTPAQQLNVEFGARTAAVRAFLEHHLGRESIPGPPVGNAADLVLSEEVDPALALHIAAQIGFSDANRAVKNLRSLSAVRNAREIFAELVILAWTSLRSNSDPDGALNNWDRYVSQINDPPAHYQSLLRQPKKLDLMLQVFASSQFLADALISNPEFLEWSLDPVIVMAERDHEEMMHDLSSGRSEAESREDCMRRVRRFRVREILRIGTRDICLKVSMEVITGEISELAVAILRTVIEAIFDELEMQESEQKRFCVLAFGKLGGGELNYSSDIDLIGVFEEGPPESSADDQRTFAAVLEHLRAELSDHTTDGHAYRVDFRLRPYGTDGPLVQSVPSVVRYYRETASPWEHQALIKLAPVAGDLDTGWRLLDQLRPFFTSMWNPETVVESIRRLRKEAVRQTARHGNDVKNGEGGIRDIEFMVQGLQMIHAGEYPDILVGNTFTAIGCLEEAGLLDEETADEVREDYESLRRLEHFLQIYEDRQVHSIPTGIPQRQALARRLTDSNPRDAAESYFEHIEEIRLRVRRRYEEFLRLGGSTDGGT